eukprot:6173170-Pleurochrysis_carterae.AAC.1
METPLLISSLVHQGHALDIRRSGVDSTPAEAKSESHNTQTDGQMSYFATRVYGCNHLHTNGQWVRATYGVQSEMLAPMYSAARLRFSPVFNARACDHGRAERPCVRGMLLELLSCHTWRARKYALVTAYVSA